MVATTTRRAKIRQSLLALIVSFLRDGTTNTALFTMVPNVSGSYPFTQSVWTFTLNGEMFQIQQQESAFLASSSRHSRFAKDQIRLPVGVTVAFGGDHPDKSKSMPQLFTMDIFIMVRLPRAVIGESPARQVAQKIDQALFRASGRLLIQDYAVYPPVPVTLSPYITWSSTPRGDWAVYDAEAELEEVSLDFEAQYSEPQEEW